MACGVHAHEVVGKSVLATLHVVPEYLHVLAVQQFGDRLVVGPLARCPGRDVALQAARVVAEADLAGCGWVGIVEDRVVRCAGQIGKYRPKIDGPILHRARGDATTAASVRNVDQWGSVCRDAVTRLVRASKNTVATQGGIRTIE